MTKKRSSSKTASAPKPGRSGDTFGPLGTPRQEIEWRLEELRERYEAGSGLALLEAVDYCLFRDFVAPPWVADAFGDRFGKWQALLCETLDDAFGVTRKHLPAKRDQARYMYEIYAIALRAERENISRNEEFFEAIGDELEIATSRVKKYLSAARKEIASQIESQKKRNPASATVTTFTGNVDLQDRLWKRVLEYQGRKS